MSGWRRPESWIFILLVASYAYFWHARDWNTASRLMLTYAMVDRGTIRIDGLQDQTGDIARFQGHFYTDKQPGFSFLAVPPYALARLVLRFPSHPLNRPGFAYWPADYWVTLGTSGVLTALTAVILARLARDLGCRPGQSAVVALAYGLATPAYAYATLSYGHQASAFALLASFALLWRIDSYRANLKMIASGFLAAYAAIIELQVGPVSAILGGYLLFQVLGRRRPVSALGDFAVGALVPTLVFLGYNQLAFGSPIDLGYFHLVTRMFRESHSAANPLGLKSPVWDRVFKLLWGQHRGLAFYAPIVVLALPGWVVLLARKRVGMAIVSALACVAVFIVNVSYPHWTGGWSTGPRLLVPLLPFAMLPVAAALASGGRWVTRLSVVLALAGGVLILLFQGAGARIPNDIEAPLVEVAWPLWTGGALPAWWVDQRFARNLFSLSFAPFVDHLPRVWQWVQFVPLVAMQTVGIFLIWRFTRWEELKSAGATASSPKPSTDPSAECSP